MKRIIIIIALVLVVGRVCHANKTYQIPKEEIIVNVWNDEGETHSKLLRLQKDMVILITTILRHDSYFDDMDRRLNSYAALNEILLVAMEDSIVQLESERFRILLLIIGSVMFNIIILISGWLYINIKKEIDE